MRNDRKDRFFSWSVPRGCWPRLKSGLQFHASCGCILVIFGWTSVQRLCGHFTLLIQREINIIDLHNRFRFFATCDPTHRKDVCHSQFATAKDRLMAIRACSTVTGTVTNAVWSKISNVLQDHDFTAPHVPLSYVLSSN